jgi:hypothetical protein
LLVVEVVVQIVDLLLEELVVVEQEDQIVLLFLQLVEHFLLVVEVVDLEIIQHQHTLVLMVVQES